jgi:hypothetical protein
MSGEWEDVPNPTNRKAFQEIKGKNFAEDAKEILKLLTQKHPQVNTESFDNILNSLCASIVIFIKMQVHPDNYAPMIQLVHKILTKNLGVK